MIHLCIPLSPSRLDDYCPHRIIEDRLKESRTTVDSISFFVTTHARIVIHVFHNDNRKVPEVPQKKYCKTRQIDIFW